MVGQPIRVPQGEVSQRGAGAPRTERRAPSQRSETSRRLDKVSWMVYRWSLQHFGACAARHLAPRALRATKTDGGRLAMGRMILRGARVFDGTGRPARRASRSSSRTVASPTSSSGSALGGEGDGRTVDLAGCVLLPGLIDLHVHLGFGGRRRPRDRGRRRVPGRAERQGDPGRRGDDPPGRRDRERGGDRGPRRDPARGHPGVARRALRSDHLHDRRARLRAARLARDGARGGRARRLPPSRSRAGAGGGGMHQGDDERAR